jgi:hypothetical protein
MLGFFVFGDLYLLFMTFVFFGFYLSVHIYLDSAMVNVAQGIQLLLTFL